MKKSLHSWADTRLSRCIAVAIFAVVGASACGQPPLSPEGQARLNQRVEAATTDVIYVGEVFDANASDAAILFSYERRSDGSSISHLTRTPSGEAVVWQGVRLGPDGTLREMELIHAQLGLVAVATFDNGAVTLSATTGEGPEEVVEMRAARDVVVGPTLFQYLLNHRDKLAGEIEFDFLSVENRGVFRFVASAGGAPGVFHVRPVDPIVGLMVPPIKIAFDDDSEQFATYQGPVPPRQHDGQAFEGLVRYQGAGGFR